MFGRINRAGGGDITITGIASDVGFFCGDRLNVSTINPYDNTDANQGRSQTATAVPATSMKISAVDASSGNYDTAQVAAFGFGSSLTNTQLTTSLYPRLP
jgi:hypothetical protein